LFNGKQEKKNKEFGVVWGTVVKRTEVPCRFIVHPTGEFFLLHTEGRVGVNCLKRDGWREPVVTGRGAKSCLQFTPLVGCRNRGGWKNRKEKVGFKDE